jgi:hypothetical protein
MFAGRSISEKSGKKSGKSFATKHVVLDGKDP